MFFLQESPDRKNWETVNGGINDGKHTKEEVIYAKTVLEQSILDSLRAEPYYFKVATHDAVWYRVIDDRGNVVSHEKNYNFN